MYEIGGWKLILKRDNRQKELVNLNGAENSKDAHVGNAMLLNKILNIHLIENLI